MKTHALAGLFMLRLGLCLGSCLAGMPCGVLEAQTGSVVDPETGWDFSGHAKYQFISWGNGMVFTPVDIFNPFDPAAVDKEYKTGDDMLYGQYLFSNGNDLQGVAVVRRDLRTGGVEGDQSSLAFKCHGFLGMNEYGGIEAPMENLYFSTGPSFFAQLAWYY